jgi:hypothetical protein
VRASADALAPAFAPVEIDLEGAPKLERKPDAPKEKKKKDGAAAPAADAAPAKAKKDKKADKALQEGTSEAEAGVPVEAAEGKAAEGKAPKAKKEPKPKADAAEGGKKKGGAAPAAKASAEDAGEPVPSMIDLRVGHIVESACGQLCPERTLTAGSHEAPGRGRPLCRGRDVLGHGCKADADVLAANRLWRGDWPPHGRFRAGELHPDRADARSLPRRRSTSQARHQRRRLTCSQCNLKPANMRGVKSFAMVLCVRVEAIRSSSVLAE